MNKNQDSVKTYIPIIILVAVGVLLYFFFSAFNASPKQTLTYSEFYKSLQAGEISSLAIDVNSFYTEGELSPKEPGKPSIKFEVTIPPQFAEEVTHLAMEKGIKVLEFEPPSSNFLLELLNYLGPFLIIIFFWFMMSRSMQGSGSQVLSFGKSKAKLFMDDKPRITFKDVAGIPEVKEELQEIIDFLKDPKRFAVMGAKVPRGVLLVGPPGCGKTYISRAVAGEAKVPFFSVSGSEFVEMFVGVGASRVRDLFEQAKKYAPALIFIDEIDAVGRQRGAGLGGGHDEREQTLNQLLVEMDGFDPHVGIIIIAATNRPDILDAALLRPGRFDRRVMIDLPTLMEREAILKYHAKNKPMAQNVDLAVVAKRTAGFSGADLENLLNESAIIATRRRKKEIENKDVEEAIDRVIAGPQKRTRVLGTEEKKKVAYHEAGHALVTHVLGPEIVHRISIVSRGMALGYTLPLPVEDKYLSSKDELERNIAGILGGTAAERVVFDEISTGASNDIRKATDIARKMVTEYGMSSLGPIAFGHPAEMVFLGRDFSASPDYSDETGRMIDQEIRRIISDGLETAIKTVQENRGTMDKLVEVLIEKETLEAEELQKLLFDAKK
ncbi:MAG TPA: ATP-dependent zinc metalloprotease FtsH [Caldisericia bacterium]|nr:ATP-dependent zinc metalloprotease FtsH [Caldisericia bacterium]HOU07547.1 ATP-dependent zinc metalloprotease FtsH [Caldisericia bacterium]HQH48701.1 ATP-dependent zinc metalloprotease FtsH [Caldisericia bacterium]HQJ43926.1 ATP-dependent zinc metalloprotease FtsH [Caldisericia bacterium]